ncbi:MAG: S26 family signal peptidase [Gammaproteobacteria bacterium]
MRSRRFSGRIVQLACTLAGIASVAFAALVTPSYRLLYNPTDSAPRGLYMLIPSSNLAVDAFALVHLPAAPARLAHERHYLPLTVPILKRVAARSGQRVCERHGAVEIDEQLVAHARLRDGVGRPLEPWNGCQMLEESEFFLLSRGSTASFDSRYFGPIHSDAVIGRAIPLWTW